MNKDGWEMNCNCGSNNCRGKIRDFKYLPPEIQQKYLTLDIVPEYIARKYFSHLRNLGPNSNVHQSN